MTPNATRHLPWLVGVLVIAAGVRVAAAVVWQQRLPAAKALAFGDSETYWQLGRAIAQGEPYEYEQNKIFRTPAYPALLAGVFTVAGDDVSPLAARIVGALLGTLTVFGIWYLAWKLFDHHIALVAAAIAAVYPGAILSSMLVLAESLFCPLIVWQFILWRAAWASPSTRRRLLFAAAAGLVAGVATLTRPSWLLFTPLAAAIGCVFSQQRQSQIQIALAMVAALLLTMTPWWVRNYQAVGTFIPTTTQVGASLYDGLHEGATGASDMRFVALAKQKILHARATGSLPADVPWEVQLDQHLRREALSWAANHPGETARLAAVKIARMWNVWPNENAFRHGGWGWLLLASYLPVIVFALLGGIWFAGRGWPYALCLAPALYFTGLHAVFIGSIRYRQPAMLPLMVMAAAAVVAIYGNHTRQRSEGPHSKPT